MMLDIDHFKKYNDTMGHDGGDALLVEFARLLQQKSRKEDLPCRYGGEEFVMVLPSAALDMAVNRANDIREAVSRMKVRTGNDSFGSVTVSIGVATFPLHGDKPDALLTQADLALYAAKHGGRNQVQTPKDAIG
jgi:diguanylate cyclase (GGDEF)-like protein